MKSLKIPALILSGMVVMMILAGCSSTQSNSLTNTPSSSQHASPSNISSQQSPGSIPASNGTGSAAQPTNTLPDTQANTISGAGTVTIAAYANLYFGSAGQIATINVKEGDHVAKGTVLAELDTTSLEATLTQAMVNLDQAKLAQTQAKSNLVTAQFNLDKTKSVSDIKDALTDDQLAIKDIEVNLNQAQATGDTSSLKALNQNLAGYEKDLQMQQDTLTKLLSQDLNTSSDSATYINGQKYDRLTVEDIQNKQIAVDLAQQTVDKSQDTIDQAQENINVAQQQLSLATITAPFDGLVATVNQNAGDIISAPSQSQHPIIYMIDPSTMEISIGVNELDIPQLKIGKKAVINIFAYPNTKLDGTVTAISPTPVVQGGITDYSVTFTFPIPSSIDVRVGMNGTASIPAN